MNMLYWLRAAFLILCTSVVYSASLKDLFELAAQKSPYWKSQEYACESSRLNPDVSIGSLFPSINATGSQSSGISFHGAYTHPSSGSILSSDQISFQQTQVNLQVSIPLYTPVNFYRYYSSKESKEIAEYQYQLFIENFTQELASRYFQVLKNKKNLKLSEKKLEMHQSLYKDILARFDVGLVAKTDLDEANSALAQAKSILIQAQLGLSQSQMALETFIGSPINQLQDLESSLMVPKPQLKTQENTHASVLIAQHQVAYQKYLLKSIQSGLLPVLNAYSAYTVSPISQAISNGYHSISGGVSLSWAPPAGASSFSQINQQSYMVQSSQSAYQQALLDFENNKDLAFKQAKSLFRQIKAQKESLYSARVYLEAAEASFDAGQRTTSDVLEAVQAVISQEYQLYQAFYEYFQACLKLDLLSGVPVLEALSTLDRWTEGALAN